MRAALAGGAAPRQDSLFITLYYFYVALVRSFLYAGNNFVISGGFQNRKDAVYWAQNTSSACFRVHLKKLKSRADKKENAL